MEPTPLLCLQMNPPRAGGWGSDGGSLILSRLRRLGFESRLGMNPFFRYVSRFRTGGGSQVLIVSQRKSTTFRRKSSNFDHRFMKEIIDFERFTKEIIDFERFTKGIVNFHRFTKEIIKF